MFWSWIGSFQDYPIGLSWAIVDGSESSVGPGFDRLEDTNNSCTGKLSWSELVIEPLYLVAVQRRKMSCLCQMRDWLTVGELHGVPTVNHQ